MHFVLRKNWVFRIHKLVQQHSQRVSVISVASRVGLFFEEGMIEVRYIFSVP